SVDDAFVLPVAGGIGVSVGGAEGSAVVVVSASAVADGEIQVIVRAKLQSPAVVVGLSAAAGFVDAEQHARGIAREGIAGWSGAPFAQNILVSDRSGAGGRKFRMREVGRGQARGGFTRIGIELSKPRSAGLIKLRMKREPQQAALVASRAALQRDPGAGEDRFDV